MNWAGSVRMKTKILILSGAAIIGLIAYGVCSYVITQRVAINGSLYKEIIDNYGGISLTSAIEPTYRELQQEMATQASKTANAQARADL